MLTVTFLPSGKTAQVEEGESLFSAAESIGLPVASSCRGQFICGRCNVQIVKGEAAVSQQSQPEQMLLQREGNPATDRISCRTQVFGDCAITTRYW